VLSCGVKIFRNRVVLYVSDAGHWHLSVVHLKTRDLTPNISYIYKRLISQAPCFDIHTNAWGVYTKILPQQVDQTVLNRAGSRV
jgi:hypothetical protein